MPKILPIVAMFQSTLPHGERRRHQLHTGHNHTVFQSTLPHGERLQGGVKMFQPAQVSIHAPAWGATPLISTFCGE